MRYLITRHGIGRRALLAGASGLLAAPAVVRAQGQGNGVALVIGNSKYKWEASLPNVRRDAPDIAKRFQALGLKTELLQDASKDAMRQAVDRLATSARGARLAAFYFAGHGASWDKDTYLVPEDADLANPGTVQSFLSVRAVSAAVKDAGARLMVFDNCRNNPADGWRQREAMISAGVTRTDVTAAALHGPNTLVLFSTAPGRVALDGPAGQNSPFAAMLLRQLAGQTVDLHALPTKLRRALLVATEGRQVLWDQSTYDRPFLLTNSSGRAADAGMPGTSLQIVELDNAYAFAREKGLLLPPGLIALRSPNGSPDSQKIGSFSTTTKVMMGATNNPANVLLEPLLLIVVSVSDGGAAEIILATKDWSTHGANGSAWRYTTGTLSGATLEFRFLRLAAGNREQSHQLRWKDANSGSYSGSGFSGYLHTSTFTRLDG